MQDTDLFDETFTQLTAAMRGSIRNADWLNAWIGEIKALQQAKRQYHAKLQTLVRETRPEFLPAKKQALQAEFAEVLASHRAQYVAGIQGHVDQLKRSVKPREAPSDMQAVLHFLKLQEIRGELKGMDPIALRGEYESRTMDTTGKYDDWLAAVEEAPTPLLPGEVLDRGRESRTLRALDPAKRQQLTDLEALRSATSHLLTLAERELPAPDPIAAQAAGERHREGN